MDTGGTVRDDVTIGEDDAVHTVNHKAGGGETGGRDTVKCTNR